jgi:hypothetical protein
MLHWVRQRDKKEKSIALQYETAEKEAQDTSCWGSGGVPQLQESPKTGGYRGLIETISAFSIYKAIQ